MASQKRLSDYTNCLFICPDCYPKYGSVRHVSLSPHKWECKDCGYMTNECWPGSGCFHHCTPGQLDDPINGDSMYYKKLR